jgi:hypothetical protein
MIDKKFRETYMKSTHKKWFSESLVDDYNKIESKLKLDVKNQININTYYLMSNEHLIYFSKILDKLGTDEYLLNNDISEDVVKGNRSKTDLNGLSKTDILNKIIQIQDDKNIDIKTTDTILRNFLNRKKINYSENALSVRNMIKKTGIDNLKELYDELLDHYHPVNPHEKADEQDTKEGHGLKPTEKNIHKKYFIDTHKLNNNVLEIRYNKNRHLTNIKTQVVGNGVKNIIHNIIHYDNLNQQDYHVLTDHEKHLIRTILNMLDKPHLLSNSDQQFNDQFQILLSEWNAGNNSEILRSQLKQYIIQAMKLYIIPQKTGNQMLIEMSLR